MGAGQDSADITCQFHEHGLRLLIGHHLEALAIGPVTKHVCVTRYGIIRRGEDHAPHRQFRRQESVQRGLFAASPGVGAASAFGSRL